MIFDTRLFLRYNTGNLSDIFDLGGGDMGTKFGNFSVLGSNIEEISRNLKLLDIEQIDTEKVIRLMQADKLDVEEKKREETKQFFQAAFSYLNNSRKKYYLGENGKWITIFSEWLEWGSAEDTAKRFSQMTPNICFSISMFDADVFTLTIFKEGNILTQHVDGDIEAYGSKSVPGDIDIIAEVFGIPDKKQELSKIMGNKGLEEKVDALEKIFNMQLYGFSASSVKKLHWKKLDFGVDEQELINRMPAKMAEIFNRARQQE
jgi:hypothetical protein